MISAILVVSESIRFPLSLNPDSKGSFKKINQIFIKKNPDIVFFSMNLPCLVFVLESGKIFHDAKRIFQDVSKNKNQFLNKNYKNVIDIQSYPLKGII